MLGRGLLIDAQEAPAFAHLLRPPAGGSGYQAVRLRVTQSNRSDWSITPYATRVTLFLERSRREGSGLRPYQL